MNPPPIEHPTRISAQSDPGLLARLHQTCADDPWDDCAMARLLGSPETIAYIAARGAEPCGLVLLRRAGEDCEILTIAVVPAMRGQGIGAALLGAGGEWASRTGAHALVLEVGTGNRPALRLYEKCGFEICGRRPAYYPGANDGAPRRDALILRRGLGGGGGGPE